MDNIRPCTNPWVTFVAIVLAFGSLLGSADLGGATKPASGSTASSAIECNNEVSEWMALERWPVLQMKLGSRLYGRDELAPLLRSADTDASLVLARQLVAAILNYAAGAKPSAHLAAAQQWLVEAEKGTLPYKVAPSEPHAAAAFSIAEALTADNVADGLCELRPGNPHAEVSCETPIAVPQPSVPRSIVHPGFALAERVFNFENGVVASAMGEIILPGKASDPIIARANTFLEIYGELFGLNSPMSDLKLLRYFDSRTQQTPSTFEQDPDAQVIVIYERAINGVPVFGSTIHMSIHKSRWVQQPIIRSISANLPSNGTVSNLALLTQKQAASKATESITSDEVKVEPIIYNVGLLKDCPGTNRIAYAVSVRGSGCGPSMRIIDPGHGGILLETTGCIQD